MKHVLDRSWPLRVTVAVVPLVLIVGAWELSATQEWINPTLNGQPTEIVGAFGEYATGGLLVDDLRATVWLLVMAFVISSAAGLLLGLGASLVWWIEDILDPYVWFFYNAPTVAFIPLLMLWIGLGSPTILAMGVLLGFFPVYANTVAGVKAVDPSLIRVGRAYRISFPRRVVSILVPGALPLIVSGLRLGLGRAFIGVIVGEIFAGSSAGLGFRLRNTADRLRIDESFAALVVICVIAVLLSMALRHVERRMDRWRMVTG